MKFALTYRRGERPESPSMRRVWIEIDFSALLFYGLIPSPSMRRVWIEIETGEHGVYTHTVTLHAEGVD